MHRNPFWLLLIFCIFFVLVWFGFHTSLSLYDYYSRSEKIDAIEIKWDVIKVQEGQFLLEAEYFYEVNDHLLEGKEVFTEQNFWNKWAAEEQIKKNQIEKWTVWYRPTHPLSSTIVHRFPLKGVVYTGVILVLTIYFMMLGYYVGKKQLN